VLLILKGFNTKHAEQTIVDLEARLQELETEAQRIKTAINCLCEVMGQQLKYDEVVTKEKNTNIQNNKKSE